jgi:release factor glutamine methyltransferase
LEKKHWSVIELINWTTDYLSDKGFDNARLETEWILSHVLKKKRIELYLNFDRPMVSAELDEFKSLLKRRLNHEPLQYILGETEFYSLPFKVNSHVLIPRPETELVVDKVIEHITAHSKSPPFKILDIGTGSGCISIALAKQIKNVALEAWDVSDNILQVARENAKWNGVDHKICFKQQNVFDAWPSSQFDIIVSNPPYIRASEMQELAPEIIKFEPRDALMAGDDGLIYYKRISSEITKVTTRNSCAFFEIGADMADSVKSVFDFKTKVYKDLANRDRVIKVEIGG